MASYMVLVIFDTLLRRLLVPLALLSAVVFRYNLFSLIYLLFFAVGIVIPSARVKNAKVGAILYPVLLTTTSLIFVLGQAFFQISIINTKLDPCFSPETILRQIGLVQFQIPVGDVLRLLLPDVVVMLCAAATLVTTSRLISILRSRKKEGQGEGQEEGRREEEEGERRDVLPITVQTDPEHSPRSNELEERVRDEGSVEARSPSPSPPYPPSVQSYWRIPLLVSLFFELLIFVLLGLAGVMVPSLLSLAYYLVFLYLLVVWSLHLSTGRVAAVARVLRIGLVVYSTLHLVLLDLYQFQSAQYHIPIQPINTPNMSTPSLLARLFGLTPLISTECTYTGYVVNEPWRLVLHDDINPVSYISPALIVLLLLVLATDLRLWLFTPKTLWQHYQRYYLPILDHTPSPPTLVCVTRGQIADPVQFRVRTGYGSVDNDGASPLTIPTRSESFVNIKLPKSLTWDYVYTRFCQFINSAMDAFFSISYIFAIIAMMIWSVVFPSWPSLVYLLWACAIWLIPVWTPAKSLFYTSPFLVVYSLALLLLQYVFSLDLGDIINRDKEVVLICESGATEGCKSLALLGQSCCAIFFFCAFREFVHQMRVKHGWTHTGGRGSTDGTSPEAGASPPDADSPEHLRQRAHLYKGLWELIGTYWILMVVGAFLLVTLTGDPSFFKVVYLLFFFYFMITYQLSERLWFYLNIVMWYMLIVYAVVHLILVYTYQFQIIHTKWEELYNKTNLVNHMVSQEDLYTSVGLQRINPTLRSLFTSLVPPTIFVAVLALQIRYFKPKTKPPGPATEIETSYSTFSLTAIVPAALRRTLMKYEVPEGGEGEREGEGEGEGEGVEEEGREEGGGAEGVDREEEGAADQTGDDEVVPKPKSKKGTLSRGGTLSRQGTLNRQQTMTTKDQRLYNLYRFTTYVFNKTRIYLLLFIELAWRFLELYLHKIICLVLFATSISQISILYWFLLLLVVVMVPFPYFSRLTYPLVTLYLGVVTSVKMIHQFPVILDMYFDFRNFTAQDTTCQPVIVERGLVFNNMYSPYGYNSNWLGLHKAGDHFASYVALPIISALLLCLWSSARRYIGHLYSSRKVVVKDWEKGSLFLNVKRQDAEKSILCAIKYFINHTFELYGIEICWCMLAITVAVRIDVYGMFYVVVLVFVLLIPRRYLLVPWICYLVLHGVLLLAQYGFLLGTPQGFCASDTQVYPWSTLINSPYTPYKKWFFLPADSVQVLDKNLLYADFLVYLLACMQAAYFRGNPVDKRRFDHHSAKVPNLFKFEYLLDYVKFLVFQYFFWVSLFLMFISAVVRVSLIGLLYMLIIFYFMFRGRNLLKETPRKRHVSWAVLRWVALAVLVLRIGVQVWGCAFSINKLPCIAVILLNGDCTKPEYYGVEENMGNEGSTCQLTNVGLWVDALNFCVITLQIILFNTRYTETIKEDVERKETVAEKFRNVFDAKVRRRNVLAQEKREKELLDLKERANQLGVTKTSVDHLLHAGVQLPVGVVAKHSREPADISEAKADLYFDIMKIKSPKRKIWKAVSVDRKRQEVGGQGQEMDSRKEEEEEEEEGIMKYLKMFRTLVLDLVDDLSEWLEERSELYREVVQLVKDEEERVKSGSSSPSASDEEDGEGAEGAQEREEVGTKSLAGKGGAAKKEPDITVVGGHGFDSRGNRLEKKLHLEPSSEQRRETEAYEAGLLDEASNYTKRFKRLGIALYYIFLSQNAFVPFFFIILNVLVNGSFLSLVYAVLLFGWGLLSIPWPSKRFWLTLIFYTMFVLVVKYAFQFHDINYWMDTFSEDSGLYPPRLIGIDKKDNFVSNVVVDILLLIFLLIHRGLLFQFGLWRSTFSLRTTKFSSEIFKAVKTFFKNLVDPNFTLGALDYYVVMLFFDILCFITIALGVNSFGVGVPSDSVTAVAQYIQSDQIPLAFVFMLLLQFLSMLVDRAIYLRHSLIAKVIFQISLLVIWHVWLFVLLPSDAVTNRPFVSNLAAKCVYFFKACYFIVSSMQIIAGYPARVLKNFLATKYSTVSWLAFNVYRLIPILPELREVMDWVFTDTTLSLINWFKVQEIYAQLYLVKVQRNRERAFPRKLGQKQSLLIKILLGVLLLSALVLLIWGPLLVISLIATTNQPNNPTQVEIKLTLAGYEPLVEITAQNASFDSLTEDDYGRLLEYFTKNSRPDVNVVPLFRQELLQEDFTRVTLTGDSTSLWAISPPARKLLLTQLEDLTTSNSSVPLEFAWTISREPSTGLASETVSGSIVQTLSYSNRSETIDMFIDVLNNTSSSDSLELPYLYPVLIGAPANGRSTDFMEVTQFLTNNSVRFVNCSLNLTSNSVHEWWSLRQDTEDNPYILPRPSDRGDLLELIIYSTRIAPPIFSAIASLGIIGLYVSVVLVIGRFIRSYVASLPGELLIKEILYPEQLLGLCRDIFLVRESKEFILEEVLVGKLFYIFRSPRMLIKLTEQPKEKVD